jgi:hypothetical protein
MELQTLEGLFLPREQQGAAAFALWGVHRAESGFQRGCVDGFEL